MSTGSSLGFVVLHVEDDDAAAYLFQEAVRQVCGQLDLLRLADGERCLAFVRREGIYEGSSTPNVIVLDLNIPKQSGLQVLEVLSRLDRLRGIPVVVFSASEDRHQQHEALVLGARRVFVKREWESFLVVAQFIRQVLAHHAAL